MNEIKFREEMAELGFYNVFRVTDNEVSFDVVNFDFDCMKRVDFTVVMNKDSNVKIFDTIKDKQEIEKIYYCCNIKLQNLNKAFELIKEFYF